MSQPVMLQLVYHPKTGLVFLNPVGSNLKPDAPGQVSRTRTVNASRGLWTSNW